MATKKTTTKATEVKEVKEVKAEAVASAPAAPAAIPADIKATPVTMPKSGITVESCILTSFNVKVGDQVKVGDTVLYSKYAGSEFKVDGKELTIIRQSDILAIVE